MQSVADWYLAVEYPEWSELGDLVITSPFGDREGGFHYGTDIAHQGGSPTGFPTPVPSESEIITVGYGESYGNYVLFWQIGAEYEILIAHLDTVHVQEGDIVEAMTDIGGMGSTGTSTGNHWHIETRVAGTKVDPETVEVYLEDSPPKTPEYVFLARRIMNRRRI